MSTRSCIGVEDATGNIRGIYCHWDGYPSCVGKILLEHYTTLKKINQLMDLGDLSILGPKIGSKHNFEERVTTECTAYGRDRGESDINSRRFHNRTDYWIHYHNGMNSVYGYLFVVKKQRWYYITNNKWNQLTLKSTQGNN